MRLGDQPRDLILMDLLALLPRDPFVRVANRAKAERQRKAKEDKRKKQ